MEPNNDLELNDYQESLPKMFYVCRKYFEPI